MALRSADTERMAKSIGTDLLGPSSAFRTLADHTSLMIWASGPDGDFIYVNAAWLGFSGRQLSDELHLGWTNTVNEADRLRCTDEFSTAIAQRQPFSQQFRMTRADGVERWVALSGAPLHNQRRHLVGFVGTLADVTADRTSSATETEGEQRLKRLIENAQDMVYRVRLFPSQEVEYAGGAVLAITGHTPAEFYDDPTLASKATHPDDVGSLTTAPHEIANIEPIIARRWVHPDGRIVWAEHRRVPIFDATGRIVALEGIARDITGVVESRQRLEESEKQMRQLAARLQSAREEERGQLSRELHDELGQTLTALKLEIGRAIAAMKQERLTGAVIDRFQSLMGLIEIAVATVKRIATDLRPPALDHLGIAEALRWEALTFKARTGIRCHISAKKAHTRLSAEQQTALFRIFQEALTNIVRHARASAVTVTLTEGERRCELRIRDNGKGITDAQAADPRAIGLLGMRERAALVGAAFEIHGRKGRGTTVTVHVPVDEPRPHVKTGRTRRSKRRGQ